MSKKEIQDIDVKLKEKNKEVKSLIANSKKCFQVETKQDLIKATDIAVKVKITLQEIEDERKEYTAPLNQTLKKLNLAFKELTAPLKEMETQVKEAINSFREKEEQRRQEKEKELKATGDNGDLIVKTDLPDIVESNLGETRTVRRWSFKVIDEKKIPRKYLTLDEKKVNQEIGEGIRNIPGLEIYQRITTSIYERKE